MSIVVYILLFTVISADIDKRCYSNDQSDKYNYDLSPLGKVSKPYTVSDGFWLYHIALCGEPNLDLGGSDTRSDAILQTNPKENFVVGKKISHRTGGEMWVSLVFSDGEQYHNHCNGTNRKAQILFICDPTLKDNGKPTIIEESNSHSDFCYYVFEWSTPLVCPKDILEGHVAAGGGTSVAKVIFVELVIIVLVYFILGVAYRRFVVGARGIEQLPNHSFWTNMAGSVKAVFAGHSPSSTNPISTPASSRPIPVLDDDDENLIQ